MENYRSERLEKYLDDLAARLPAPGGGSVVALVGALGVGLLSMVSNFTLGKEKYKKSEEEIKNILERSEDLRERLTGLVDEDIRVYNKVSGAYKLPRTTDKEKEARSRAIEKACKEALTVPMEAARCCCEGLEIAGRLVEIGNVRLVSDVGVAAGLLEAALKGAELNVNINLKLIEDKNFVEEKKKVISSLVRDRLKIKDEILKKTEDKI
ncbi:MAG: cyclodeaminase/cyclohydrolase family protein [Elusimicrobiota bacterium]|nr:cyclodeaminase/cyclohydrolase family protein [Elusimicrobiota bacterium]